MKKIALFFLCLLIQPIFGQTVEDGLRQIPFNEKMCMRAFFDNAIKNDQAGHVLYFDSKPACLTGPILKDKHRGLSDIVILKGWNAFKKHEHLFPHANYIFNSEVFEAGQDFKVFHIYIINRKSTLNCIQKHFTLFKEILGETFTANEFITTLENGMPLSSAINHDEMLRGLLLGYGLESSKTYKNLHTEWNFKNAPPWTDTYQGINLNRPTKCKIIPVVFIGNPQSTEVRQLKSTYETELEVIWNAYQTKDPLIFFLECICKN